MEFYMHHQAGRMNRQLKVAALGLLLSISSFAAVAAPIALDFEGAGNDSQILNFYNLGTDSQGNSGSNYGVSFSQSALALIAAADGSSGFSNVPSGSTVLYFDSSNAWLNIAAGFSGGFSLYFSSALDAVINLYDGENGSGQLIASLNINNQFDRDCAGDSLFCSWSLASVLFDGTARSIDFSTSSRWAAFDKLTLGVAAPVVDPVPSPAPAALFAALFVAWRKFRTPG
jgi:hypothetical protein